MNGRAILRTKEAAALLGIHPSGLTRQEWWLRESFRVQGIRGNVITPEQLQRHIDEEREKTHGA